jgi:hypothetical protein
LIIQAARRVPDSRPISPEAVALMDELPLVCQSNTEFTYEARLPNASLARDQHHLAEAIGHPSGDLAQRVHLVVS